MKIAEIVLRRIRIPFKEAFRHALAERRHAENLVVCLKTEEGTLGYGECVPREYVTGETVDSAMRVVARDLAPRLWRETWNEAAAARAFAEGLPDDAPAARCAVELALLDAAGKTFSMNAARLLGWEGVPAPVFYSGVISADSPKKAARKALLMRLYGFRAVKLKVGDADDTVKLERVRRRLGRKIGLRVDANGAWTAAVALKKISEWKDFNLCGVEQPVPKEDWEGMREVAAGSAVAIVADESFCTLEEARRLAEAGGCDILNIRLSKCGGLTRAREILELARRRGMGAQLGCQVGETALLSAAGRIFAQLHPDLLFAEGSYEKFLLREDISRQRVRFRAGGKGEPITGPGLGVEVDPAALDRLTQEYRILKRG